MSAFLERRRVRRVRTNTPLNSLWRQGDSLWMQGTGVVRDISTAGLFTYCREVPPPGAIVRCHILLQPFRDPDDSRRLWMTVAGRVLRTEYDPQRQQSGFALECRKMFLREQEIEAAEWRRLLARYRITSADGSAGVPPAGSAGVSPA